MSRHAPRSMKNFDWVKEGEWFMKGYEATEKMGSVFQEAFAFINKRGLVPNE